jgi:hypothetical protein
MLVSCIVLTIFQAGCEQLSILMHCVGLFDADLYVTTQLPTNPAEDMQDVFSQHSNNITWVSDRTCMFLKHIIRMHY